MDNNWVWLFWRGSRYFCAAWRMASTWWVLISTHELTYSMTRMKSSKRGVIPATQVFQKYDSVCMFRSASHTDRLSPDSDYRERGICPRERLGKHSGSEWFHRTGQLKVQALKARWGKIQLIMGTLFPRSSGLPWKAYTLRNVNK